jgi:hypothetical protein
MIYATCFSERTPLFAPLHSLTGCNIIRYSEREFPENTIKEDLKKIFCCNVFAKEGQEINELYFQNFHYCGLS